jgi:hypothetical protein
MNVNDYLKNGHIMIEKRTKSFPTIVYRAFAWLIDSNHHEFTITCNDEIIFTEIMHLNKSLWLLQNAFEDIIDALYIIDTQENFLHYKKDSDNIFKRAVARWRLDKGI